MIVNELDAPLFAGKEFDCTVAGAGLVGIYVSLILSRLNIRVLNVPGGSTKESWKNQAIAMDGMASHSDNSDFANTRPRVIGGSGKIWGGRVQSFDPWDFEQRKWLGTEAWPIGWDEITKLYREVSQQLGFEWLNESKLEKMFDPSGVSHSKSLDIRFAEFWLREKDFFKKFSKELEASRNLFILENCNLVLIETSSNWEYGNNKTVKIISGNGRTFETRTKTAVLALGAVENSRMLLNMHSANGTIKEGERNGIGKNFMIHLLAKFPHISAPDGFDVLKKYKLEGVSAKRIIQLSSKIQEKLEITNSHGTFFPPEANLLNPRNINSAGLRFIKQYGLRSPIEVYSRRGIFVEKLRNSRAQNLVGNLQAESQKPGKAILSLWGEHLPSTINQVKLTDIRDHHGGYKSEIKISVSELDLHSLALTASSIEKVLSPNQNLDKMKIYSRNRLIVEESVFNGPLWGHQMGGTKLAKSQSEGVTMKSGETFTFPGIYICGTSVFPSGSHAAPTFTALALSLLTCKDIKNRLTTT